MTASVSLFDLGLVMAIDDHNPTLNLDLLRQGVIIPQDWQLVRPPVCSQQGSQLLFTNGISLVSYPDRVVFLTGMARANEAVTQIVAVAQRYIQALPQGKYRAMSTNLRAFLRSDEPQFIQNYFGKTLLQTGPWLEAGKGAFNPSLTLNYELSSGTLMLSICPAEVQVTDKLQPAILFAGSYSKLMQGDSDERLQQIQNQLVESQQRVNDFTILLTERFLDQRNASESASVLAAVA
jgi:hypothetical protein